MSPFTRSAITLLAGLGAVAAGTAVPAAAAQSTDTLDCSGHPVIIRLNDSNSSERGGWASVQIVEGGSGHFTPVRFTGTLTDTTADIALGEFSSERGNGNVPPSKTVVQCTTTIVAPVSEFVENLQTLPPGAALDDDAALAITAYVTTGG